MTKNNAITIVDGIRLDCRSINQSRNITVKHDKEMTMVCIGGTKAIAHCHALVTKPSISNPTNGVLSFSCEITPMADPSSSSHLEYLQAHITKELNKALKNSNTIDTESLVILPGEYVWNISCHVKVIDNDGNATDACLIAAIASLLGFKRPDVTITDQNQIIVHPESEKYPIPLTFHQIPVPTTFALIPASHPSNHMSTTDDLDHNHQNDINSNYPNHHLHLTEDSQVIPVLDPSLEEESFCKALFTITSNIHGQLVSLSTFGSCSFDQDLVTKCIFIALNRAQPLTESIRNAVLIKKELK